MSETTTIPQAKKRFFPLTPHTRSRIECIQACAMAMAHGYEHGLTTPEMARVTGYTTNNCAKRAQEAAVEEFLTILKVDGRPVLRRSLDSGRMLEIWIRTDKPLPTNITIGHKDGTNE